MGSDPSTARFRWHHVDQLPSGFEPHYDDASHASVSMRYIALLNRDLVRLNTLPTLYGEPIPFDASYLRRFANTFLYMTRSGDLSDDVNGAAASPIDDRDGNCNGWVDLLVVEPRVYDMCHDIGLRLKDGTQPYLGVGKHSALLADKRLRYPVQRLPIFSPKLRVF